jgi:threonine dehydrogenase-like Zn-dependent dehydrogenase
VRAVRFHYRPVRYLLTRYVAGRRPGHAVGRLGCVSLDEVEPPALPGPDWVRIETTLSGICGSDLSAVTAHDSFALEPFGAFPFTFGHENVGRVVATGSAVTEWQPGDDVIVNPMLACEQRGLEACPPCARGEYGLCRRTQDGVVGRGPMIGYCPRVGGGWSPGFVAHASQLHGAGGLAPVDAVLADPLASALRPVLLHPPAEDDVVLVIGAGTIGALTIAALRAVGWQGPLACLGRYDFQLALAEAAGASVVFRRSDEVYDWAAQLPHARSYRPMLAPRFVEGGPSLVYDTVGSQGSIEDALALTREGGRIILVGAAAKVATDWTRVWYRQLTVAGIFAYGRAPAYAAMRAGTAAGIAADAGTHTGAVAAAAAGGRAAAGGGAGRRDIYESAIALLREERLGRLGLVTHEFALEDYRAALAAALDKGRHRSVKVVFRPA